MLKDYFSSTQTVDSWVDTIEQEFPYVKADNYNEIVKILSITSTEEIDKIKKALLIAYAKKVGILTFEDACQKLKILPIYIDDEYSSSLYKLKIIAKALNNGWYPNWNDSNEYKYVVYMRNDSGFSYCNTRYCTTIAGVPSALCLKTNEMAYFMANYFVELYKIYFE